MYVDPYERFIYKPVERKAPLAPTVPYERVRPAQALPPPPPISEPKEHEKPPRPKRKQGKSMRRAAWPKVERVYLDNPSLSLAEIGAMVNMHHTAVYYALKTMGIYVPRHDPAEVAKRLEARVAARKAGRVSIVKRQKERRETLAAVGKSSNPWAKLDFERVRAARHMFSQGFTYFRIGRIFHVHPKTIWNVVHRQTWKHVP